MIMKIFINQSFESDNNNSSDVSLFFLQAIEFGCMQVHGGAATLVPPLILSCVE